MQLVHALALGSALCLTALGAAQTQIHVSPTGNDGTGDGSSGNPYKTISYAESVASSGAVLVLGAGTFGDDEQIVIGSKNITIVGSGVGTTVVRPHPTLVLALPRGFPNAPFLEDHRCVFVVDGAARVDIRDLTVDCAFRTPATGRLTGIYYRDGADGTVQNVEITNCRTNPLNGIQGPAAAIVRGDGVADTCDVTFRECFVHEWGKGGIISYFDARLTVEQCTVTGSGRLDVPLPAQNCVQLTYGAVGVIRNNTITDSSYIPSSYGASGILLYDAGAGTVIEGNELARCEGSIWVVSSTGTPTPISVRSNTVTACYGGGLWVQGAAGLLADGNTFGMPLSGEIPVYDDDLTTGNTWSNNRYSDNQAGTAPYAIDGGSNSDASPVAGCRAFASSSSTALGAVPVEVLALQLDGSGGTDFVTVNEGATPSLSVGLESAGSYPVSSVAFGNIGGRAVSIVAGDFDGVGGTDVAVLTVNIPPVTGENKVYVFSNTGGVLSLLHTESLPAVYASSDLAVGDFDSDGVDDLAVADLGTISVSGTVTVLQNGGVGTTWSSSAIGGFATQCVSLAAGDIDGDGASDLVVAEGNGSNGRVHVFAGSGTGTFAALGSPITVANNPLGLALADLDADGALDVLVCSYGAALPLDSGVVTALRNNLPTGFDASVTPTDRGPVHVAAGDLDADDDPDTLRRDAVVTNFAGASLTVCGSFSSSASFSSGALCAVGTNPRASAIADMDGDGFGDLVVADAGALAVVIVDGTPTARVDVYGIGCPGTSDRIPVIAAVGAPALPTQPNLTFGIECRDARPLSVAVLNASFAPGPSFGPCDLLLASIDVSWVQFTNSAGTARVSIAIPAAPPSLLGAALYFQWAVIDPQGDLFGLAALSNGLKIRIGG